MLQDLVLDQVRHRDLLFFHHANTHEKVTQLVTIWPHHPPWSHSCHTTRFGHTKPHYAFIFKHCIFGNEYSSEKLSVLQIRQKDCSLERPSRISCFERVWQRERRPRLHEKRKALGGERDLVPCPCLRKASSFFQLFSRVTKTSLCFVTKFSDFLTFSVNVFKVWQVWKIREKVVIYF